MIGTSAPSAPLARARPDLLERLCQRWLGASWTGCALFALAAAAVAAGEPERLSLTLGAVISLIGEALRIITAGYGYKVGELSVRGPYRYLRHPYFLGTTLLHFGLCIAARNVYVMAIGIAAVGLLHRRALRRDEERLALRLGPAYVDYRARVPAFLPRLFPAPAQRGENREFSFRTAVLTGRHRELDALLGLALAFGLMEISARGLLGDLFRPAIVITTVGYAALRLVQHGLSRSSLLKR